MKVWVQNQDRTILQEVTHISVEEIIVPNTKKTKWCIVANFGCVGEYESKERCMEILEKILALIALTDSNDTLVFKMPLE